MSNHDLMSIFLTNIIGIALTLTMIIGNRWRFKEKDKENQIIVMLLILTLISCVVDPIAFLTDGHPGLFCRIVVYATNTWYYLVNIIGTAMWIVFMEHHIKGCINKRHLYLLGGIIILVAVLLIINLFVPIVFSVDKNNVYARLGLGFYFGVVVFALIVDCIVVYFTLKKRAGELTFFPIFTYSIPLTVGAIIQGIWYGISLAWPCAAISIAGVLTSLQNEMIFRDKLTGLYNRYYLDNLKNHLKNAKNTTFAIMMIDINDFKSINDNYGHLVGDRALIETSQLLVKNVNAAGTVVRYAGDEFVIVFNAQNKWDGITKVHSLKEDFDEFNKTSGNQYELSISVGCGIFDLGETTIEDILAKVDESMYEDKARYYEEHPEKSRRER